MIYFEFKNVKKSIILILVGKFYFNCYFLLDLVCGGFYIEDMGNGDWKSVLRLDF